MSYAIVTSTCAGCSVFFGFNPNKVPSIPINGVRQAICMPCAMRVQDNQRRDGLEVTEIHPQAYEPLHDSKL